MTLLLPSRGPAEPQTCGASDGVSMAPARPRAVPDATLPVILFLALQFVLPGRLVLPGLGGAGRPAVVGGATLLVWWLLTRLLPERARHRQPLRIALAVFLGLVMLAYAVGQHRGLLPLERRSADRYLIVLASWLGVTLVLADGLRSRRSLDRVVSWLVGLTSFSALIGGLQFYGLDLAGRLRVPGLVYNQSLVGLQARGGPAFNRVYGTMQHYIEFGVVLSMVLPLAIHLALVEKSPVARRWRWACVALLASCVPFSISRSGAIGIACAFVVLAAVWARKLRLRSIWVAAVSLVVFRLLVPGVLGTIRSLFTNLENDPSIDARKADYGIVADYVADRPFLGRGPGTFVPEIYRVLDNQFLGSTLEVGLLGVTGILVLLGTGWALARQVRLQACSDVDGHLGQALAATLVVAIVTAFTFDSLSFPTYAGTLFVALGLIGALWRLAPQRPVGEPAPVSELLAMPLRDRLPAALRPARPVAAPASRRVRRATPSRGAALLLALCMLTGAAAAPWLVGRFATRSYTAVAEVMVLPPSTLAAYDAQRRLVEVPNNAYKGVGTLHQIAANQLSLLVDSAAFRASLEGLPRVSALLVQIPVRSSIIRLRIESQDREAALAVAQRATDAVRAYLGQRQRGLADSQQLDLGVLTPPEILPVEQDPARQAAGAAVAGACLGAVLSGAVLAGARGARGVRRGRHVTFARNASHAE